MQIDFRWLDENNERIAVTDNLTFTQPELLWAALTVGAPSYSIAIRNILDAPAFALHKWFAIRSVADIRDQEIILSPNYYNLDQSEKVVLSFWAGMIFAKLVAEKILHVPWMAHARLLQKEGRLQVDPPTTKSLPDLVGLDQNWKWHVIEAKGLQKSPSNDNREHYTEQAKRIVAIDGQEPESKNYCITYIRSQFAVELHDPHTEPKEPLKFEIKPDDLQQFYYKPFKAFFSDLDNRIVAESDDSIIYKKVICDTIDKKKCYIGIVREIFDQIKEDKPVKGFNLKEKIKIISELADTNTYIGPDGIAVKLVQE